jgi:hypothetical protein
MSLISIGGHNPFDGQKDPYLSMDSSIDYNENPNGQIKNTYTLQGLLTGCDKHTLNTLRDNLVKSFDWKDDSSIPENIIINGIISSSQSQQIIPTSLEFESSNYVGALSYTLKLEVFTGFDQESVDQSESLIDQTHTVTTTVNEKGCVNVTTNISCAPNQNLTGCSAIDKANAWINKQLGAVKIGQVNAQASYPLQNESLTINPITSEVSYTSTHGHDCSEEEGKQEDVPGEGGLQMAQCIETKTERPECEEPITVSNYQGEIYKPGSNEKELLGVLSTKVLSNHPVVKNLNAQYSATENNITYSFETKEQNGEPVYEPKDQIINDYTISVDQDYDSGGITKSLNGTYRLINPEKKTKDDVLDKNDDDIEKESQSLADAADLTLKSKSITRNPQEGTLSYSYSWSNEILDEDGVGGKSGIDSYSISVTPPIQQYEIVPVLNCEDYIIDKGYASQGFISISVTSQGTGSNSNIQDVVDDLTADYTSNMVITEDSTSLGSNSISRNISAIYKGDSVIDKNKINQL